MKPIFRAIPIAVRSLIALSACGSGANNPKGALNAVDQALARKVTLRLSDFPSGWKTRRHGTARPLCRLNLHGVVETGIARSPVFLNPTTNGRALESSFVVIYRTTKDAKAVFAKLMTTTYRSCIEEKQKEVFEAKGARTTVSYHGKGDLPRVGDRSGDYVIAYAFKPAKLWGIGVEFDLSYVQRGRTVISLVFAASPSAGRSFPQTWPRQDTLARILMNRLEAAPRS